MSNRTFLGKVGMTPKGEWNSSTTYERLDIVSYQGSSYIAIAQNVNSVPTDSNPNWMIGAKHGEFTEEQLEEFKEAVVAESKQEMDDYTDDKKDELDTYTTAKKGEIDTHAAGKISDYDANATTKTTAFNTNAETKTTNFNDNVTSKTNTFNQNAEDKTTAFNTNASAKQSDFNSNATSKTNTFNQNASDKTDAFNSNASSKTTDFNDNADSKTQDFDDNASEKTDDFDTHVQEKTDDFDEHADEILVDYEDYEALKRSRKYTVGTGESVTLNNTAEGVIVRKLGISGNSKQVQLTGKNKLDVEENLSFEGVKVLNVSIPAGSYKLVWTSMTKGGVNNPYIQFSEANTGGDINSSGQREVTLNNDVSTVYIYSNGYNYDGSQGVTSTIKQLMLIPSTETDTSYEPYIGGIPAPNPEYECPIQSSGDSGTINTKVENKNRFDIEHVTWGMFKYYNDNSIKNVSVTDGFYEYIQVKSGETISISKNSSVNTRFSYAFLDKNDNVLSGLYDSVSSKTKKFNNLTVPANATRVLISQIDCLPTESIEIQVEYNSTATAYTPHAEQNLPLNLPEGMELCKIGDCKDYFYKSNGKWYLYKIIGKKVIGNDVDVYSYNPDYNGLPRVVFTKAYIGAIRSYSRYIAMSDNWHETTYSNPTDGGMTSGASLNEIWVWSSEFTSLEVAKSKIVGSTFYSIQATPTITEITDTTLISQLEAIQKVKSYYEQTNVSSTDEVSPIYEVEAYQDENLLYNEIETIKARLDLLEG